jgi:hypothetical protein
VIRWLRCWLFGHQWQSWERFVIPASEARILRPCDVIKHVERCSHCGRFRTFAWHGNTSIGRIADEVDSLLKDQS